MMRYVALLRGIGPTNPNMKGEKLKAVFEGLGFRNVHTVIASGNVIFDSPSKAPAVLEEKIEKALPENRHSLSLPGAAPPTPPDGRLPSAATGSAERSDRLKSFPGDEMGPGREPHLSASILPPARQLGRRREASRRCVNFAAFRGGLAHRANGAPPASGVY